MIKYNFFDLKINDKIKKLRINFDNCENLDNIIAFNIIDFVDIAKNIANKINLLILNICFFDIAKHITNETN